MLIHLEKLGKSFGEKVVLHDVTASVEREDRIGIVGQNGAGKTTLLKILTGEYQDYDGEFSVTHGVTLGYLEQNAKLDPTLDIYGEMRATFAPVLDVLRELSEVATLAVVSNGVHKVQTRRLAESGVSNFMEDVFISEKLGCEKPGARIFDAALRALGVENREHVLMVGDSLTSDIQGGANAGLDTCWFNPNHTENPGKVIPTYEIASLEELYPLVMEQDELANVGLKNRRHQC